MRTKKTIKSTLGVFLVLVLIALAMQPSVPFFEAQAGSNVTQPYPIGTPTPTQPPFTPRPWPTISPPATRPTPTPPSEWAQRALQYVAERYNVPIESLLIVNEHERRYPLTGRTFWAFVILDTRTPESPEYSLLIDATTGQVEEDIAAVEAAEDTAYLARYGKLQPALHDRLQEVTDDTVLPVAIWMAGYEKQRTREEIYAELAAQFPEAAQALARGTKPMDVGDPELSERIQEAYRKMRAEDVAKRTQPLVAWLRGRGFSVKDHAGMPSLTAMLPKRVILEIAARNDVTMIYLIEEQAADEMTTAIPTDRVPGVWRRGIDGSGQRVAILEDGNIDSSVSCLNIVATRNSPQGTENHKTRVASIVACDADPYRGVAYGAQLIDAGFDSTGWPGAVPQQDAVDALQWAIQSPQNADVVNASFGAEYDNNMNWLDRAFDYWAREENVTIGELQRNKYPKKSPKPQEFQGFWGNYFLASPLLTPQEILGQVSHHLLKPGMSSRLVLPTIVRMPIGQMTTCLPFRRTSTLPVTKATERNRKLLHPAKIFLHRD